MKCARCGRDMDKAAAFVGGNPIGPKCWEKMGDKSLKFKRIEVVKSDQMELFNANPISTHGKTAVTTSRSD